jgi:transmembrane sensor
MTDGGDDEEIAREAAQWLARLNSRSVSTDELQRFYAWRREPGHAAAYDKVEQLWRESRSLGDDRDVAEAVREALERPRQGGPGSGISLGRRQLVVGVGLAGALAVGLALLATRPDRFETAVGEQRSVVLADGSRLRLNTDSALIVDYSRSERRIELTRGEASFEVNPDPGRQFIVETGGLAVRAIGTSFEVRNTTGLLRVILVHGSVAVARDGAAGGESRLAPGQALVVTDGGDHQVGRIDLEAATSWTTGRMIFRETPLADAIAEANRYSTRTISLRSEALKELKVDGTFEAGDTEALVAALTALLELRAEPTPGGDIVLTAS